MHLSPPRTAGFVARLILAGLFVTATSGVAADESAEIWLDRLEAAADDTRTLRATARMTSVIDLLDETTIRFGELTYAASADDQPARFAVRFKRLLVDNAVQDIDKAYIYDGRFLLERDARDRTATRRELVAEGEEAELELGDGPFPVPLNLKKDRVLGRFTAEVIAADAENDPQVGRGAGGTGGAGGAGSVHLRLTPREGVEMEAESIDLWFDRATLLPLRAATLHDDGDRTIVDLFNSEANVELAEGVFDTALPAAAESDGWQLQDVPLD